MVEELERLKSILLHMTSHINRVVDATAKLFRESNLDKRKEMWREIDETSALLEKIRRDFVNEVLIFMARRQPLGRELLIAHTLINIAYDVYRISRYCREIARIDFMLAPDSGVAAIQGFDSVFGEAANAVRNALNDLTGFKPSNEQIIAEIDSRIDERYKSLLKIVSMKDSVGRIEALGILVMRHIERIVDHANYIEGYLKDIV
ncbi:MAG: PhoU domain-containing protein [Ignisphaera sp.]|nr:hypothetical protein [Ignisphaera sp.]MDW8085846.1 PhoU domain-containing protein [Ignisphaera sp.]